MSTITPNMGLTKPDPDGSIGTWDTEINATIDLLDAHDHASGSGVQIPTAGIDIDADIPLNNFAATQVKALDLAPVAASTTTSYATALYVDSADNELYWRTSGGVAVKLTLATSLNAALLGGFTGDYGSGGSQANFTSGTAIYNFLRAANHRAFIDSSDIRLFEGTVAITNAVKLRSPNTLAASYDFIYPTALPGAQSLLQITSGGQVVASSALANNESVTVSGTGTYKRGAKWFHVAPVVGNFPTGTAGETFATTGGTTSLELNEIILIPIVLQEGERLLQVVGRVLPDGASDIMTMKVFRGDATGTGAPSRTQLGSTATLPGGSTQMQSLTVASLTETAGATDLIYFVEFQTTVVVTNGVGVHALRYQTDVP